MADAPSASRYPRIRANSTGLPRLREPTCFAPTHTEEDPQKLWHWYIQLTEVEDAFRTGKGDLGLRPVFHQKQSRVQAHIFICFLALAMWRSLEMWLKAKGLGDCARQVIKEMGTIHSMDVVLPVRNQIQARLRLVGKPEPLAADLLARMGLKLPTKAKNVVEKTALF